MGAPTATGRLACPASRTFALSELVGPAGFANHPDVKQARRVTEDEAAVTAATAWFRERGYEVVVVKRDVREEFRQVGWPRRQLSATATGRPPPGRETKLGHKELRLGVTPGEAVLRARDRYRAEQ